MSDDSKTSTFDVTGLLEAKSVGRMRSEVTGRMVVGDLDNPMYQFQFEMATDEGSFHGGADSAPPPLAYFCTGLVTCLMTQIRACSKRLRIEIGDVRVTARIKWEGRVKGRDPYTAHPIAFELDVDLASGASEADQRRLLDAAQKSCFVEATLAAPVPVEHRLRIGGDWLDA